MQRARAALYDAQSEGGSREQKAQYTCDQCPSPWRHVPGCAPIFLGEVNRLAVGNPPTINPVTNQKPGAFISLPQSTGPSWTRPHHEFT